MKKFDNDPKDRKRRFLRGLNAIIGLNYYSLEDANTPLSYFIPQKISFSEFRKRLANTYCLELINTELIELINKSMTTGDFTEKYCPIIYQDRGKIGFNELISYSMIDGAVDLKKIDNAPKYGLNGGEWCDVAEGPCSCGAWH